MADQPQDVEISVNGKNRIIRTTVTCNQSTVEEFISSIYFPVASPKIVGLDCEFTSHYSRRDIKKLSAIEQAALANQEPQRAAVLQLCVGNRCLVYQIYQAHARELGIPPLLRHFLADNSICFAGAAIGNDIKKLQFYDLRIENAVDLQRLGIKVPQREGNGLVSLEDLAKEVASIDLNKKNNQITRRGPWEVPELSSK